MKKLKILTAVICFCCFLAGCTASTSDTSSKSEQSYLSDSSSNSVASSSSSQSSIEYTIEQLVGTFKDTNAELYGAEEWFPTLELYANADFTLRLNLVEGMGEIYGTYSIDENFLILIVTDRNYYGFMGDDLETIRFKIIDVNTLLLVTSSIAFSIDGDTYIRQ